MLLKTGCWYQGQPESSLGFSFPNSAGGCNFSIHLSHGELCRGGFGSLGAESFEGTAEFAPRLIRDVAPVELADKLAHRAIFLLRVLLHGLELLRGQRNGQGFRVSHGRA